MRRPMAVLPTICVSSGVASGWQKRGEPAVVRPRARGEKTPRSSLCVVTMNDVLDKPTYRLWVYTDRSPLGYLSADNEVYLLDIV